MRSTRACAGRRQASLAAAGVSPAGRHTPNTAVAQAYYYKQEGTKRLATETGAGQWGTAQALACSMFDLDCTVYMVKAIEPVGEKGKSVRVGSRAPGSAAQAGR
jgi:predicted alternative tryptophan synthase beta-subunit